MSSVAEKASYHVLNIKTASSHRALSKLKQEHGTWESALFSLGKNSALDPQKEWEHLQSLGVDLLLSGDEDFPTLLKEIPLAPHGIYIKGKKKILNQKGISIVGTRKPSARGAEIAREFAKDIALQKLTIISGLAFGIDTASHKGCLDARGETIAVLPSGLDRIYPRSNERLAKDIIESAGALVSEFPPGAEIFAYNFLQRNRIISGLSIACCLIEVPAKSGALATARFALDQNREVLALPGAVWDPHYAGSNRLIKEGAHLITSSSDIFEILGIETAKNSDMPINTETEEEEKIIAALRATQSPASIDKLAELSKLNIQAVAQTLTFLTLRNIVKETDAGFML